MIDNEHIRFERNYEFHDESKLIDFNTKLTVKSTEQEIKNSTKLYPITQQKLQKFLEEAGFIGIEFFGSFNRESLTDKSLPLVAGLPDALIIQKRIIKPERGHQQRNPHGNVHK